MSNDTLTSTVAYSVCHPARTESTPIRRNCTSYSRRESPYQHPMGPIKLCVNFSKQQLQSTHQNYQTLLNNLVAIFSQDNHSISHVEPERSKNQFHMSDPDVRACHNFLKTKGFSQKPGTLTAVFFFL